MSILSKVNSALEEEGLGYVIQRAPHYIRRRVQSKISDGVYRIYNPYGELSRGDMISHCENNDQIWYYGSDEEFEISPPLTEPIPQRFQDLIGVHESPPSFVCELKDIRLVGDRAIPQMRDGRFVLEEMGKESMLRSRLNGTLARASNSERIDQILAPKNTDFDSYDYDVVVNLVHRHGPEPKQPNYAHWVGEDLPRLRGLKHYENVTGESPMILISQNPSDYITESLKLMGYEDTEWSEWVDFSAKVRKLIVPKLSYRHTFGAEFNPSDRKFVRDQLTTNINPINDAQGKRLFVSRQGAERRKIQNYNEIKKHLCDKYGFKSIQPELMSLAEEVQLFSQADLIVGPYGTNLQGFLYSDDATVVSIHPESFQGTDFYIVAQELDLDYSIVWAKVEADPRENYTKNMDMKVDPDKLTSEIENHI